MHGTQMMPTLLDLAAAWMAGPSTEMGENGKSLGCRQELVLGVKKDKVSFECGSWWVCRGGHRTKAPLLIPRLSWGSRHGLRT